MQFKLKSEQKKLLTGLGNPGKEYDGTRHNAGFLFLDFVTEFYELAEKQSKTESTALGELTYYPGLQLYLLKPATYMNLSGKAVAETIKYNNIGAEQLLLVHDDLDVMLGKYKLQLAKSPREHKGVLSVEQTLGIINFWRLRIGIDNRTERRMTGEDYVLGKFTPEELQILRTTFTEIVKTNFVSPD
jgi:PTH1 family peptidyl-tRNA hydrolase